MAFKCPPEVLLRNSLRYVNVLVMPCSVHMTFQHMEVFTMVPAFQVPLLLSMENF